MDFPGQPRHVLSEPLDPPYCSPLNPSSSWNHKPCLPSPHIHCWRRHPPNFGPHADHAADLTPAVPDWRLLQRLPLLPQMESQPSWTGQICYPRTPPFQSLQKEPEQLIKSPAPRTKDLAIDERRILWEGYQTVQELLEELLEARFLHEDPWGWSADGPDLYEIREF